VSLFLKNDLPVTSNQGGVIEAKLPPEPVFNILTVDENVVVARGYVVATDRGTEVTLMAEEAMTRKGGGSAMSTRRIKSAGERGRALRVWQALEAIASGLRADSTLAAR